MRPEVVAAAGRLAAQERPSAAIVENLSLNGEAIRLDGAVRTAPR